MRLTEGLDRRTRGTHFSNRQRERERAVMGETDRDGETEMAVTGETYRDEETEESQRGHRRSQKQKQ